MAEREKTEKSKLLMRCLYITGSSDEDGASSNALGMLAPEAVEPYRSGKCTICLELDVDTVLYKCGHMCVCYGCGMNLKAREAACPLCRAPIRDIIRIYR